MAVSVDCIVEKPISTWKGSYIYSNCDYEVEANSITPKHEYSKAKLEHNEISEGSCEWQWEF